MGWLEAVEAPWWGGGGVTMGLLERTASLPLESAARV